MITIRYADLPEGLHAQAEAQGRHTIIYLRPGLTPEQRRDSLRRARQYARMGRGPRLTAAGVSLAVAWDIVRGTLRNMAAALRTHPLGSTLLAAAMAAGLACYVLFVTVSIRLMVPPAIIHPPGAVAHAGARPARPGRAAWPGGRPGGRAPGGSSPWAPLATSPARPSTPAPTAPSSPTPVPAPTAGGGPSPSAHPSPSARPSPPAPSPSSVPAPSPTRTSFCILIVCLP